jgi:hypothetical protein
LVLLTGSGDELFGWLPALLQGVAYHLPAVGLPAFPVICLLIDLAEISSLPLSPSLVHFQCSHTLCCVLAFCSLFIVRVFFCVCVWKVSLPRGLCWFILGVAGGILRDAWRLPVWSAECVPGRFGDSSNSGSKSCPPVFSV